MTITTSTPAGITTTKPVRLLTNLTGSSVALELKPGIIQQVEPEQNLFYDTTVDTDVLSDTYNVDIIDEFVSNGVLSDNTLTLTEPTPKVETLSGGTFVAIVSSNKNVKLATKEYTQTTNHLDILPVVNEYNQLLAIFYRDAEGISYSLNGGASTVLISNDNLQHPDEITSLAVQIYETAVSSVPILRLFVGTLREGLKTFTPAKDTTYQDYTDLDNVFYQVTSPTDIESDDPVSSIDSQGHPIQDQPTHRIDYLFRHYTRNIEPASDDKNNKTLYKYITVGSNKYSHVPLEYAPVYIVGILNFTSNNGCPLIVYTRTLKDTRPEFKYCIKNLHDSVYVSSTVDGRLQKTLTPVMIPQGNNGQIPVSLWPAFTDSTTQVSSTGWTLVQSNSYVETDFGQGLLPVNVVDILTSIECSRYNTHNAKSITLVAIKYWSSAEGSFVNEFLRISSTDTCRYTVTFLPSAPADLRKENYLTGVSCFTDPKTGNETVYVTTDSSVWRYTKNVWGLYIGSVVQDTIFNTKLNSSLRFDSTNPVVSLTGLKGFSIAAIPDMSEDYIGYLGSNIGIIQYQFSCINGVLCSKDTIKQPARLIRTDLYNSYVSALSIPSNTNILISCCLKTAVPIRYDLKTNSTYLSYIPTGAGDDLEYFERANYLVKNEPVNKFYTGTTYPDIKYTPSDQIFTLDSTTSPSLKLKTNVDKELNAGSYPIKFLIFANDGKLYGYLNIAFGKYVHLYINHVITRTICVDSYTYTLQGTSTYYVPVNAPTVMVNEDIVGYFVKDYIRSGYTTET